MQIRTALLLVLTLLTPAVVTAEDPQSAGLNVQARAKPAQTRRLLIFTHSAGYRHGSIAAGANAIMLMGRKTGAFDGTVSSDPAMFDAQRLNQFDAVMLVNTTGDWLKPKGKKVSEETIAARKKALLEFVASGKGLAGCHAASDSNYKWKEFGEMIGGYFDGHPWHQKIGVTLEEPRHTLLKAFGGKGFEVTDEIYQFKEPYSRDSLRVLLTVDNQSVDAGRGRRKDKDFAIAWIRNYGKGRVFYSSLGHREEIYRNNAVMQFYLDGLQYALGDLTADATPSSKVSK